ASPVSAPAGPAAARAERAPSNDTGRQIPPAGAARAMEVKVPDIGDFKDVPIIEVFVKPGDTVKAEDPLVTLESDKATMDVPSPSAGGGKEMKVKLGDNVSEGTVLLMLEAADAQAANHEPA